jgi:hypothetical protein
VRRIREWIKKLADRCSLVCVIQNSTHSAVFRTIRAVDYSNIKCLGGYPRLPKAQHRGTMQEEWQAKQIGNSNLEKRSRSLNFNPNPTINAAAQVEQRLYCVMKSPKYDNLNIPKREPTHEAMQAINRHVCAAMTERPP